MILLHAKMLVAYLVHEVGGLSHEDVLDDGNPVGVEGGRVVDGSSGGVGAVLRLGGEEELRPL